MVKVSSTKKNVNITAKVTLEKNSSVRVKDIQKFSYSKHTEFLRPQTMLGRTIVFEGHKGVNIKKHLKKPISSSDFYMMIEQIVDIANMLKKEGIPQEHVLWIIDAAFVNEATSELNLIYLPIEGVSEKTDVKTFVEALGHLVKPADKIVQSEMAGFYYFLKNLGRFDTKEIENYIYEKAPNVVKLVKSGKNTSDLEEEGDTINGNKNAGGSISAWLPWYDDDSDDDYKRPKYANAADSRHKTKIKPRLKLKNRQRMIDIDKDYFIIGRKKEMVDFCIEGDSVSREHAAIIINEERCFIKDLDSKNKTYVNGREIIPGQKVELKDGSRIRIGNEEMAFYL